MFYAIDRLPAFSVAEESARAGNVPSSALKTLKILYEKIADDDKLAALTVECCNAISCGRGKIDCGRAFFSPVDLKKFHTLLIFLSYPAAKANFARAKYAKSDFEEVWRDLGHWAQFYLDLYGEVRFDDNVFGWYFHHVAAQLVQLGRLQFQLPDFYREEVDLSPYVAKGDPVIDLHIYAGEPLTPDACRESLHKLQLWLKRYQKNYDYRAVISDSWIFDPALDGFLPQKSNIREVWKLGKLIPTRHESDVLWRIFAGRDPESVAEKNPFQQKVLDFYRNGGKLHYGYLVIPRENAEKF